MKQFRCYSEISNAKGDATKASINSSGIYVIGLARPKSLPYSDLNENPDDLKNSQKIKDLTKSKNCFECSGQCENLFKIETFLGVRCTLTNASTAILIPGSNFFDLEAD